MVTNKEIKHKKHVMVDLETLSVQPNGVILTLGAIKFDPWDNDGLLADPRGLDCFYRRIDPESFTWPDAHIDENTVKWWASQDAGVREEAFAEDDRHPIREVLTDFHKWLGNFECVWANGSVFDIPILEWSMRRCEKGIPWKYWNVRDTRTIYGLVRNLDAYKPTDNGTHKHHALWDCWVQIVTLQNIIRTKRIERE